MKSLKEELMKLKETGLRKSPGALVTGKGNAASECPYGKCGGGGIITKRVEGIFYCERCKCAEDRLRERKAAFANIPWEFRGLRIKDFETGIYKGENIKTARTAKNIAVEYVKKYGEMKKGLYFYSETGVVSC